MKPLIAKVIRQLLLVCGGACAASDVIADSDIDQAAGAISVLIALVWSWAMEVLKRRAAQQTQQPVT